MKCTTQRLTTRGLTTRGLTTHCRTTRRLTTLARLVALAALAAPAAAQVQAPGSLLVFPEYDTRPGALTLTSITNTSPTQAVRIVLRDIDSDGNEFLRTQDLEASETWVALHALLDPNAARGFAIAYVVPPNASEPPLDADVLVGSLTVVDAFVPGVLTLPVLSFRALAGGDPNGNGLLDLDGVEFEPLPSQWIVPSFIGVDPARRYDGELILVGMSGGRQFETTVELTGFDDEGHPCTVETSFRRWTRLRLEAISPAFTQASLAASGQTPGGVLGASEIETGWIRLRGKRASSPTTVIDDPAILAVYVQRWPDGSVAVQPLYGRGRNTSGKLFPHSNDGQH